MSALSQKTILEIDIGNTRIKWRLRQGETLLQRASIVHDSAINYDALFAELHQSPEQVLIVTVIVAEKHRVEQWCLQHWACPVLAAEVRRECAGVYNAYHDLAQMGPDRWVAMVAAYSQFKCACVVIDCGSACTVDLLAANGQHLGGYIVPGLALMKDALFRDTDRVKLSLIDYIDQPKPGCSTEAAVASGSQLMLMGMIAAAADELMAVDNQAPLLVVTGGAGDKLSTWLTSFFERCRFERCRGKHNIAGIELRADLVFEGLPLVCDDQS